MPAPTSCETLVGMRSGLAETSPLLLLRTAKTDPSSAPAAPGPADERLALISARRLWRRSCTAARRCSNFCHLSKSHNNTNQPNERISREEDGMHVNGGSERSLPLHFLLLEVEAEYRHLL